LNGPVPSPLDPARNRAPAAVRHVHLMGICGTGMAALACMLQERGLLVTGSDSGVYPPMSELLAAAGIPVRECYAAENLDPAPDLVVVGNVIRAVNPEAVALGRLGLPYLSLPQALARLFLPGRVPIVVAGTHGKTTTSSMLATVLAAMGEDPGCMIGGVVEAFGRNARIGGGPWFVIEGDEYDTAFFDKGSKFLHYQPRHAILTSVEFDHADIFADLDAVIAAFRKFIALIPPEGSLTVCADEALASELAAEARCRVIRYGSGESADWRLRDVVPDGRRTRFLVDAPGLGQREFTVPMPGRHNVLNAMAVLALLHHVGLDLAAAGEALGRFQGVKRRQQVRGEVGGITIIDDFAHHPTAVRETLAALHAAYPGRRLVCVFEPRTNSSRRRVFQQDYVSAFDSAELVLLRRPVPLADLPAAARFSSETLAEGLRGRGLDATCHPDTEAILGDLAQRARAGDVVAVLSNGGFDNIHERLLERLRTR